MAEPSDPSHPSDPSGAAGGAPSADELDRLREELEAEKAGSRHWRDVARRREAALAELKQRTSVRAVLSAERRTASLRAAAQRLGARVRARGESLAVATAGLAGSRDIDSRRRDLDRFLAAFEEEEAAPARTPEAADDPANARRLLIVQVGGDASHPTPTHDGADRVVTVADEPALAAALESAQEDVIGIIAGTTELLTTSTWARLSAGLRTGVAAATGITFHPERAPGRATAHDLLVRSAGVGVELDGSGAPHLTARSAGSSPDRVHTGGDVEEDHDPTTDGAFPVVASAGTLLVIEREAMVAAGGYVPIGSVDASVIDLCLRMRRRGGATVCLPDVVAFDHRHVSRPSDLVRPLDESKVEWRTILERHGPSLRRAAAPSDVGALDLVITVASPMRKVAEQWGDWHLAQALARAMEDRGHHVELQTLDQVGSPRSLAADVHLVLRGLARIERSPGQAHVLWVISHPEDLDDEELDAADLVLVASSRFAEVLRTRTTTPVEVMLQATDPERFRPLPPDPDHRHDVTVVGKSRDVLRPMVRDAIAAGIRPAVYGSGWGSLIDPSLVVADHVDNADLPRVYSSAGVVLNDHWDTMRAWGFVSNRIFDVLACGTPVVSDPVPGLDEAVGDLVPTWTDPAELAQAVDAALASDRASFAERARSLVLERHTFAHRAAQLEAALRGRS